MELPSPSLQFSSSSHGGNKKAVEVRILVKDGAYIKPKRVLTPYNFFFQDERRKMLQEQQQQQQQNALQEIGLKIEKKGIGFANMARTVSARWKVIDDATRQHYLRLSAQDKIRHNREMQAWNRLKADMDEKFYEQILSKMCPQHEQEVATLSGKKTMDRKTKKATKPNEGKEETKRRSQKEATKGGQAEATMTQNEPSKRSKHCHTTTPSQLRESSPKEDGQHDKRASSNSNTYTNESSLFPYHHQQQYNLSKLSPDPSTSCCAAFELKSAAGGLSQHCIFASSQVTSICHPGQPISDLHDILQRTQEIVASFEAAEDSIFRSLLQFPSFSSERQHLTTSTMSTASSGNDSNACLIKNNSDFGGRGDHGVLGDDDDNNNDEDEIIAEADLAMIAAWP